MADPNNPSQRRAYDPQEHAGGNEAGERRSDPLAELARLIGQSDPFVDYERGRVGAQALRTAQAAPLESHQDWPAEPAHSGHQASSTEGYPAAPDPYAHRSVAPHETEAQPYAEPYPADSYGQHYPDQADPPEYSAEGYQQDYDPYAYGETGGEGLDESDYLAQQAQRQRRRRLATVIAILVFAVVGGAGAYGYRTFFDAAARRSPPPVIKADTTPNKVIPTHAGESRSAKLIYDRVGEGKQAEHVVPREEQPVDLKTATIASRPQVAPPTPDAVSEPSPTTIPITGRNPSGPALPTASEPTIATQASGAILPMAKKVHTVVIRPDMTIVPNATPVSDPTPPRPASLPIRQAAAEPEQPTRSVSLAPSSPPSPAHAEMQRPPSAPPAAASRRSASAPLSLSPSDVSQPAATPAQRTAARTAPPRAAAAGNYIVQVSSQRSEAEANASFRTLQGRYPKILGGRASFVRRADLGTRGTYYRSMVGPFATAEEAVQFCGSLKTAGGKCIIHRN
jgi:hypothetical protein